MSTDMAEPTLVKMPFPAAGGQYCAMWSKNAPDWRPAANNLS